MTFNLTLSRANPSTEHSNSLPWPSSTVTRSSRLSRSTSTAWCASPPARNNSGLRHCSGGADGHDPPVVESCQHIDIGSGPFDDRGADKDGVDRGRAEDVDRELRLERV